MVDTCYTYRINLILLLIKNETDIEFVNGHLRRGRASLHRRQKRIQEPTIQALGCLTRFWLQVESKRNETWC